MAPAGVISLILVALAIAFILPDGKQSASSLYCVLDPSSSYVKTLNASQPHAQCFRVLGGVFTEVLADASTSDLEGVTYLNGNVIPGLIDSHGHLLQYGEMLESVLLYDAQSLDEVRARIKDFLSRHSGEGYGSPHKWVRGIGWDQRYLGGVMPTAVKLRQPSFKNVANPLA